MDLGPKLNKMEPGFFSLCFLPDWGATEQLPQSLPCCEGLYPLTVTQIKPFPLKLLCESTFIIEKGKLTNSGGSGSYYRGPCSWLHFK